MLNKIDLSRVDLNLLTLFEVVLQEQHVGQAADRLHLSASAVSHGLGRLRRLLNDPLFLRTPKGVVPTERATQLAEPIADLLARARSVIATAEPFNPATSARRFVIGAPDGISAAVMHPLLAELERVAPRIDIGVRQILPSPARVWQAALGDLDDHAMDVAIIPSAEIPTRFEVRRIYDEEFVIVARSGHSFARNPSLDRYCQMPHLVVSHGGDPYGFVDQELHRLGRTRRVTLTVPNFMFALAVIAETEFISALPRRFVALHGARFGVVALPAPLPLPRFAVNAVAPKVALMDAGLAWLLELLVGTKPSEPRRRQRSLQTMGKR